MTKASKVQAPEPGAEIASPTEVSEALGKLADADLVRLERYGRRRLRGCKPSSLKGRDWNELMKEAISKTLEGSRRWSKKVPLVQHLIGVMRSTASHWDEEAKPDPAIPASQLVRHDDEGRESSPYLDAASRDPAPDRVLAGREEVSLVREAFKDDVIVSLILDGVKEGYRVSELPAQLGVSDQEVGAGMKRLRRYGDRLLKKGRRP